MYGVTPKDIRDAAYGITIAEGQNADTQIEALIDKAEIRLTARIPTLPARVANETVGLALVRGVVEDMVIRVLRNPKALRSIGIDDYQSTIDNSATTGLLYVSDDEYALLAPSGRCAVGSIQIGIPTWRLPGVR